MAPELTVLEDAHAVARHAAAWLAQRLDARAHDASAVCLSGGATPRLLYERLASIPLPWSRIHWFWGDERFVSWSDERSNYGMVQERLLARAPIPRENVHAIPTARDTPETAAAAYEEELMRFHGARTLSADRPLFEVTFLGMGEDGHTASLFPGSAALRERSRWAVAVRDAGAAEAPAARLRPAGRLHWFVDRAAAPRA